MGVSASVPRERERPRIDPATVGLLLVVAAAAALRFATITHQSYWYDEGLTVELVRSSFGGMLAGVHAHEGEPPLYFMLAWGWTRVFGYGEAGLRSLSALLGVLTVPVAFAAARTLVGLRTAIVTAALVAVGPALIWYSQEARAYPLLVFLCAVSLMFFARSLDRGDRASLAGWAIASVLAITSHYFAVFLVVPEAAWLVARFRNRRSAALAVGGVAAAGLALLPYALYQRAHGGVDWITTTPLTDRVRGVARFFATATSGPSGAWLALGLAALLAAAGIAIWRGDGQGRHGVLLTLGLGTAAVAIPVAAALAGADYVLDRNLLPAWIPLAIVLAAGMASRKAWPAALVLGLAVFGVFLRGDVRMVTDAHYQRDDWRGVARALGPARPDRVIVVVPAYQATALALYTPLRPLTRTRRVREVDVVTYEGALGWARDPRGRVAPGRPFELSERRLIQRMGLVRYRAPGLALVARRSLVRTGQNPSHAFVQSG